MSSAHWLVVGLLSSITWRLSGCLTDFSRHAELIDQVEKPRITTFSRRQQTKWDNNDLFWLL